MNVGILSLFYKNYNYGGVLQAYALNKAFQRFIAEDDSVKQICFDFDRLSLSQRLVRFIMASPKEKLNCICEKIGVYPKSIKARNPGYGKKFLNVANEKIQAFNEFNAEYISSTEKIYGENEISETLDAFDCFVVGSDQVWNPDIVQSNSYFLDFVGKGKYKASYAASISKTELSLKQQKPFKKNLDSFNKISVRENNIEIISHFTKNKVEWVLDPTLLLSIEDWNEICSTRFDNEDSYVFCYFLNDNKKQFEFARMYAKSKGYKILCTTDLRGIYENHCADFCDSNVYDASPADFLSLVKNAAFVMTDSFHAAVFSLIFQKQFLVFERADFAGMKTRMETLLQLFDAQSRLVNWANNSCCNIEQIEEFNYSKNFEKFNEMKLYSEKYLDDLIKEAKELVNEK